MRSIFRFAFYGYLSSEIMGVTEDEARIAVQDEAKSTNKEPIAFKDREIWALNTSTLRRTYDRLKIYYILPAKWFFSLPSHPNY